MANTFVQFRADESIKNEAIIICSKLGIDLPTYMRICLSQLVSNNGFPFEMTLNKKSNSPGIEALNKMNEISRNNGNENMTLEEINNEINEARIR